MNTTKIIELFIDDDTDEAGIEAISLVSRPAHDENWQAFNSVLEEEKISPYNIVEDNFCDSHPEFFAIGESYSDLLDQGWDIVKVEKITPSMVFDMQNHKFVNSRPNESSPIMDTDQIRVRYKYIGPRDNKNRQFCAEMLRANKVYRIEDIENLSNPEFGNYNIFLYRGSFNCRHAWVRLVYKKQGRIRNDADDTNNLITSDVVIGPDTRNKGTIAVGETGLYAPRDIANPRKASPERKIEDSTPRDGSQFTPSGDFFNFGGPGSGRRPEGEESSDVDSPSIDKKNPSPEKKKQMVDDAKIAVRQINSDPSKLSNVITEYGNLHGTSRKETLDILDDVETSMKSKKEKTKYGLDEACWEGYEPIGLKEKDGRMVPNCVPIKMTEDDFADSISDYPEGVKNSAKKAIAWAEKNGWGSCGTSVGKIRANQLAKGEPISIDTIKRMYSYLSRHKVDLQSSKSYEEGCGLLMYDSWGGDEALRWAERKLQQIEKQKMTFAYDEDKKILIGAAMVPNRMIHRYDDRGELYYVFFSKESIKKMAAKFLREKRTDETSIEHNGIKLGSDKVYITESWISEDPIMDKSHKYGFELPTGTWFVEMKIKDDKIWKLIKSKTLNGFSVEGLFAEKSIFSKEDKQINKIKDILKSIKDE